jgi:hypothetical protein
MAGLAEALAEGPDEVAIELRIDVAEGVAGPTHRAFGAARLRVSDPRARIELPSSLPSNATGSTAETRLSEGERPRLASDPAGQGRSRTIGISPASGRY